MKIKKNEKRKKYLDLAGELKKSMEHEGNSNTNCNGRTCNDPQSLVRGLEELEIGRRAESIQTTALLRSVRILRRVLEVCNVTALNRREWRCLPDAAPSIGVTSLRYKMDSLLL